jgi:multiple sugar transport system substrate-binding protein
MNVLQWPEFYSKVPNAVASGAGPDCAAIHLDQVGTQAARRVIMPLDDFVGAMNLTESDFSEVVWKAGIYDEKRYAIPLDVHPLGQFTNNGLLEKAGVQEAPQDRESFEAAVQALKTKGGVPQPFWTSATFPAHIIFHTLLGQFGGQLYDEEAAKATFNSEAGVEALNWYTSHIKEGNSPKNVSGDAELTAFTQGRNAITWNGIWQTNNVTAVQGLDVGGSPIPQIGDQQAVWASSHQLVVMQQRQADENKLHAARDFLAYLSENSLEWAKAGQVPARNSVRESEDFKALKIQSALAEQLDYALFLPTVPGIGDVTAPTWEQAVNEVVLGKAEPKAALDDAAGKATKLLEDNRKKYTA